jgi:hypothetical protein
VLTPGGQGQNSDTASPGGIQKLGWKQNNDQMFEFSYWLYTYATGGALKGGWKTTIQEPNPAGHLFLQIMLYWNSAMPTDDSITESCFCTKSLNKVAPMKTIWPSELKIFIAWPYANSYSAVQVPKSENTSSVFS